MLILVLAIRIPAMPVSPEHRHPRVTRTPPCHVFRTAENLAVSHQKFAIAALLYISGTGLGSGGFRASAVPCGTLQRATGRTKRACTDVEAPLFFLFFHCAQPIPVWPSAVTRKPSLLPQFRSRFVSHARWCPSSPPGAPAFPPLFFGSRKSTSRCLSLSAAWPTFQTAVATRNPEVARAGLRRGSIDTAGCDFATLLAVGGSGNRHLHYL